MLGLDTNVLVRLIVDDDSQQAERAQLALESQCSKQNPGFINSVVLAEISWVLAKAYGYGNSDVAEAIEGLLAVRELTVQYPVEAWEALNACRDSNVGFADFYLAAINKAAGCRVTMTFDGKAAKTSSFELIP